MTAGPATGRVLAAWPIVAFGLLLIAFCSPPGLGDTNWYVNDVLVYSSGHHAVPFSSLLEFGHLVWRPLGALLNHVAVWLPDAVGSGPRMKLAAALSFFSTICGVLAAALMFDIVLGLSGSRRFAFFIAACFLCADASLTYLKTGNAYVPGLFFVTLALWCALESTRAVQPRLWLALLAGVAVGVATLFWFTNVLLMPAIVISVLLWNTPGTTQWRRLPAARLRSAIAAAAGFGVTVAIGYGVACLAGNIRSADQFLVWYRNADTAGLKTGRRFAPFPASRVCSLTSPETASF
jgi:hypothetical protein